MLSLIKKTVPWFAMLAVMGCDPFDWNRNYRKTTENGKTTINVGCEDSAKDGCEQYLRSHCLNADIYKVEVTAWPNRIDMQATCQE
jgi:hypothetical protein